MIGTVFYPLSRVITAICVFFSTLFGGGGLAAAVTTAPPSLKPLMYPAWVHQHWVWENESTQDSAMEFVQGFLDHDIPVGVNIIDRPWATACNTYVADKELFPDMQAYIDWCHEKNIKVTVWAASNIDEDAEIFQEGKDKGYYLSNGKTVKWWGGKGAFLDYTNPDAVAWWHSQMDKIIDMGVDGWKVDGVDPYVMLLMPAYGKGGYISWSAYKKQLYSDFYNYSISKNPNMATMARPSDDVIGLGIPLTFMPREVNFSGWVGDRDNTWFGLRGALNGMFSSSLFNYVSYGSDIGGFRNKGEKDKELFIRWAQMGALSPIMENGGGGEHRPWKYDEETVNLYREAVKLHYKLIPYITSQVAYSFELNKPTMRPQLGIYEYLLGDDIFVAPLYQAGNERTITFPKGEWIYFYDETKVYSGIKKLSFPLNEYPMFIRKGAIIPIGPEDLDPNGTTTVAIYPEDGTKQFGLYEQDKNGSMLSYTKNGAKLTISSGASDRKLLFRVYGAAEPTSVTLGSTALTAAASLAALEAASSGYFMQNGVLWIAAQDTSAGVEIVVE